MRKLGLAYGIKYCGKKYTFDILFKKMPFFYTGILIEKVDLLSFFS